MFEAARRNRTDVLQFLVDLGVSVDVRDAFNTRPLHHAASRNALQAARFLIERGARSIRVSRSTARRQSGGPRMAIVGRWSIS
jgi:ankyrin repeat protein